MSLKAVEMQIALPRTQDASKLQSEWNDRWHHIHAQTSIAVQKDGERKQKTVSQNEELYLTEWKNDDPAHVWLNKKGKNHEDWNDEQMNHPFKGHFVDYFG